MNEKTLEIVFNEMKTMSGGNKRIKDLIVKLVSNPSTSKSFISMCAECCSQFDDELVCDLLQNGSRWSSHDLKVLWQKRESKLDCLAKFIEVSRNRNNLIIYFLSDDAISDEKMTILDDFEILAEKLATKKQIMEYMSTSRNCYMRAFAAWHTTQRKLLERLSEDDDDFVRSMLLWNEKISVKIFERLLRDDGYFVRVHLMDSYETFLQRFPKMRKKIIENIKQSIYDERLDERDREFAKWELEMNK